MQFNLVRNQTERWYRGQSKNSQRTYIELQIDLAYYQIKAATFKNETSPLSFPRGFRPFTTGGHPTPVWNHTAGIHENSIRM